MLRRLIRLTQAYWQLEQFGKAEEHIEQATPLAKTMGSELWREETLSERAAVYAVLGVPIVDGD